MKFLDEELGQRYSVVCVKGLVAFLPVQHQVVVRVCVLGGKTERKWIFSSFCNLARSAVSKLPVSAQMLINGSKMPQL